MSEEIKDPRNPKDLLGTKKQPLLSVVPPASIIYEAAAMRFGAFDVIKADGTPGYGPYNWREKEVLVSIYVDACLRHVMAYWDGEDVASDSKVHHLAHAKACLGIIIDALENKSLVDNRPKFQGAAARLLEALKRK